MKRPTRETTKEKKPTEAKKPEVEKSEAAEFYGVASEKPSVADAAHKLVEEANQATEAIFSDATETLKRSKEREAAAHVALEDKTLAEQVDSLVMTGTTARIVTNLFDQKEWFDEWQELRGALRFRGRDVTALGRGDIEQALDAAQDNAHRAAELTANIKHQHDVFEYTAGIIRGSMREKAKSNLEAAKQAAKQKGELKKAITNDDVEAEMCTLFPDVYAELESRASQAKRMIPVIEDLAERLAERARDLRQMLRVREAV